MEKEIAVNKCFGGFSLSPEAVKRLAELNGKDCYFFRYNLRDIERYEPISLAEAQRDGLFFTAFSIPNPNEYLANKKDWHEMTDAEKDEANRRYEEVELDTRPEDRADKKLIKVIKELGKKANGSCADIRVVKIPKDVDWEISEYDGLESIHEKHRSW